MSKYFFSLSLVFYFYNVKFVYLNLSSYFIYPLFIFVVSIYYYFFKAKTNIAVVFRGRLLILFTGVIFSIFSLFLNVYDNYDFLYLRNIIVVFVCCIMFSYVLLNVFNYSLVEINRAMAFPMIINSIFIIGMFAIPEFKSFWLSLVESQLERLDSGADYEESMMYLRMVGVTGFSGYSTAVTQIILLIFYTDHIRLNFEKPKLSHNIIILFVLVSAMMIARTSFVLMPLYFFFYFHCFGFLKLSALILKGFGFLLMAIYFIFPFLFGDNIEGFDFFTEWLWGVFRQGGETGSLSANISMFRDFNINTISMLGDSRMLGDDGYYKNTDVGYFRVLYGNGILGLGILILFIFSNFIVLSKKNHLKFDMLGLILASILLITMCKGLIIFDAFPLMTLVYFRSIVWRNYDFKRA